MTDISMIAQLREFGFTESEARCMSRCSRAAR